MEHIKQFQIKNKTGASLKSAWYAYLSKNLRKTNLSNILLENISTFIDAYNSNTITEDDFTSCLLKNDNDSLRSLHVGVIARICLELDVADDFVKLVLNNYVINKKDLSANEYNSFFSSHTFSELALISGVLGYVKSSNKLDWNINETHEDDWIELLNKLYPECISQNTSFLKTIGYVDKGDIKGLLYNMLKKSETSNNDTYKMLRTLSMHSCTYEIKYIDQTNANVKNLKHIINAFDNVENILDQTQKIEFLSNTLKTWRVLEGSLDTFEANIQKSYIEHIQKLPSEVKEAYTLALQLDSELPIVSLLYKEQSGPCTNYNIEL